MFFPVPWFKIPVPGIFFPSDRDVLPIRTSCPTVFFYCGVWSLFGDLFFLIIFLYFFFLYNPGPQILGPGPTRARNSYLGPNSGLEFFPWARNGPRPGILFLGNLGLCELDSSSKFLFFTWKLLVCLQHTFPTSFCVVSGPTGKQTNVSEVSTLHFENTFNLFPVRPKL